MAFGKKSKSRSVVDCPLKKGSVAVHVVREDTGTPIPNVVVNLSGPTPGSDTSDKVGWAVFQGRSFGDYSFTVKFPHDNFVVLPYGAALSVNSPSTPTMVTVRAYPTGTLNVKVIRDDTNAEIKEKCTIYSVNSPESLRWEKGANTAFKKVICGEYTVTARVPELIYEAPDPVKGTKATVPENGSADAVIVVTPKAWITVRVHDKDAKLDVLKFSVELKAAATLLAGAATTGSHQFSLSRKLATTCDLQHLTSDDDVLYEVIDLVST